MPDHPTEYSPEVIAIFATLLHAGDHVHDPFAGRGLRLGALCDRIGATFTGTDIEAYRGTRSACRYRRCDDAAGYPAHDVTTTSPCYFDNRISSDYVNGPTPRTKLNGRHAYGTSLGRALHPDNLARFCRSTRGAEHDARAGRMVEHWAARVILNVDLPIAERWRRLLEGAGYDVVAELAFTHVASGASPARRSGRRTRSCSSPRNSHEEARAARHRRRQRARPRGAPRRRGGHLHLVDAHGHLIAVAASTPRRGEDSLRMVRLDARRRLAQQEARP